MKKILFFVLLLCFAPVKIFADKIYNINIDIDIQKDGTAYINEIWDVKASSGSEWFKTIYDMNLTDSVLSDFQVSMDGNVLQEKSWNVNDNIDEKKAIMEKLIRIMV